MYHDKAEEQQQTNWEERTQLWISQAVEQQKFQEKIGEHISMIFSEKKIYELEQEMLHHKSMPCFPDRNSAYQ